MPFGRQQAPAYQPPEILLVLVHQTRERAEVVRHAGDDLLLGEPLGQRDLDRAVEGQRALVNLNQRADGHPHRHGATNDRAAEPFPRDLDLLGQGNLFRPRQQGNLRHLAQIHANRIAAELHDLAGQLRRIHGAAGHFALGQPLGTGLLGVRLFHRGGRIVKVRLGRASHQIDALFLQGNQQIVELIGVDFLVGQVVVDFVVGQIALRLPAAD